MFRELFDTAPDAMVVVDHGGAIVRANSQAERLFGYAESELLGRPIEILLPEHARSAHHAHRAGYIANPHVRPMGSGQELTGLKRNGQQFPVEIALSPINTPDGRLFLASIRDVSETQRARQALVRARYDALVAQLSQVAFASPDVDAALAPTPELVAGVLGVEAMAIVFRHPQFQNAQVRAWFGIAPELLDALPWSTFFPDASMPANPTNFSTIAFGADSPIAAIGIGEATVVPLIDVKEPMGALLVFSGERRDFDHDAQHLLRSVANLLTSAMQRARTEEQLSHAQRLEAIGQLTGGIAHDFNNLLTVVSGNLQILEDELADRPDTRDIISSALRAVGRGAELTRKLLAFARRQRLAPAALDSTKLLEELGAMLRRTLGETVTLEISCGMDVPHVFADPGQLDNALVNLALNSRDAMPRGGLLMISARQRHITEEDATEELPRGDYVVFSVRDSGMGMAPEVLARAFEPFFTTKEHGKGSGLGLSMVYGFVKQSGGHLTVESQLGYGTRIDLHLPAAQASASTGPVNPRPSARRGSESILVVEDEADVRDIAVTFLRTLGYTVIAAADADAALEQLRRRPEVALVFSDVVLGTGMTGIELADEVRRLRPGLPVVLTSGYEHAATGSAEFSRIPLLPKPYRREELAAAIRGALDG